MIFSTIFSSIKSKAMDAELERAMQEKKPLQFISCICTKYPGAQFGRALYLAALYKREDLFPLFMSWDSGAWVAALCIAFLSKSLSTEPFQLLIAQVPGGHDAFLKLTTPSLAM